MGGWCGRGHSSCEVLRSRKDHVKRTSDAFALPPALLALVCDMLEPEDIARAGIVCKIVTVALRGCCTLRWSISIPAAALRPSMSEPIGDPWNIARRCTALRRLRVDAHDPFRHEDLLVVAPTAVVSELVALLERNRATLHTLEPAHPRLWDLARAAGCHRLHSLCVVDDRHADWFPRLTCLRQLDLRLFESSSADRLDLGGGRRAAVRWATALMDASAEGRIPLRELKLLGESAFPMLLDAAAGVPQLRCLHATFEKPLNLAGRVLSFATWTKAIGRTLAALSSSLEELVLDMEVDPLARDAFRSVKLQLPRLRSLTLRWSTTSSYARDRHRFLEEEDAPIDPLATASAPELPALVELDLDRVTKTILVWFFGGTVGFPSLRQFDLSLEAQRANHPHDDGSHTQEEETTAFELTTLFGNRAPRLESLHTVRPATVDARAAVAANAWPLLTDISVWASWAEDAPIYLTAWPRLQKLRLRGRDGQSTPACRPDSTEPPLRPSSKIRRPTHAALAFFVAPAPFHERVIAAGWMLPKLRHVGIHEEQKRVDTWGIVRALLRAAPAVSSLDVYSLPRARARLRVCERGKSRNIRCSLRLGAQEEARAPIAYALREVEVMGRWEPALAFLATVPALHALIAHDVTSEVLADIAMLPHIHTLCKFNVSFSSAPLRRTAAIAACARLIAAAPLLDPQDITELQSLVAWRLRSTTT